MSSLAREYYTPEEYLALERNAEYKSEYMDGQLFAMTWASRAHNVISGNIFAQLHSQLKGRLCETYMSDMRVKVSESGMYVYPDVVAVCGEPRFEDTYVDTLVNPGVIIEVLSPSTEAYDRGGKFAQYGNLESLTDYVLVSQDKIRVELYTRYGDSGKQWMLTLISNLGGKLSLTSIGCELSLHDIYENVEFLPQALRPQL